MASWPERLVSELDTSDESARALTAGLSAEQLNWQPTPGAWSIGQCLDHLCATTDVYLPPMASALEGKPKGSTPEIAPGWFGRLFLKNYVEPSPNQKRLPAPKKIVPRSQIELSVLDRFLTGNQAAREFVNRAREYDVNRIRFRNPFIALIRFTVGTGLEIVTQHQRRHLLQAERVRAWEGFPR